MKIVLHRLANTREQHSELQASSNSSKLLMSGKITTRETPKDMLLFEAWDGWIPPGKITMMLASQFMFTSPRAGDVGLWRYFRVDNSALLPFGLKNSFIIE